MNNTFALAATLAAGIALAPIAGEAAVVRVQNLSSSGTVINVPAAGVFSPTSVGGIEVPVGEFTDRWYFDLNQTSFFDGTAVDLAVGNLIDITFNNSGEGVFLRSGNPLSDTVGGGTLVGTFAQQVVFGTIDAFQLTGVAIPPLTGTASAPNYYIEITGTAVGLGGNYDGSYNLAPVPVPAALPLMLTALAGLGLIGRRRMQVDA